MKLINIVKQAQQNGLNVTYRMRPEGGVVVTSINGTKYQGKAGNMALRTYTGHQLSARQQAHVIKATKAHTKRLKVIAQAKKQNKPIPPKPTRKKPKRPKLTKRERAKLREAQKAYREAKEKGKISKGKPTAKRVKEIIRTHGHKEAREALLASIRHAKGIIYVGQVDFLIRRIQDIALDKGDDPTTCVNIIKRHKTHFLEEHFLLIKEEVYKYDEGVISINTLEDSIRNVFKMNITKLNDASKWAKVDPFSAGPTGKPTRVYK